MTMFRRSRSPGRPAAERRRVARSAPGRSAPGRGRSRGPRGAPSRRLRAPGRTTVGVRSQAMTGDHDHAREPPEHRPPRHRRAERRRRRCASSATRSSPTSPASSTRPASGSVPVVWVQHSDEQLERGSDEWRIVAELSPDDAEPLVEKHYGDAFEDTTLETVLGDLGVGRLVVAGAQTDACIRATLHGAFTRGYDATLVSDAHTTEDQTEWGAPPPSRSSLTPTCTGRTRRRRGARPGPSRPRRSISPREARRRGERHLGVIPWCERPSASEGAANNGLRGRGTHCR